MKFYENILQKSEVRTTITTMGGTENLNHYIITYRGLN